MWLDAQVLEIVVVTNARHVEILQKDDRSVLRCSSAACAEALAKEIKAAADDMRIHCASREWSFAYLNVYDLQRDWRLGLINTLTWGVLGAGGLFHAAVEVYGEEWMFGGQEVGLRGSGISACQPRGCSLHTFRQSICLGLTSRSVDDVMQ
ncbi:unnamed protein product, partial [Polarella glacialis]